MKIDRKLSETMKPETKTDRLAMCLTWKNIYTKQTTLAATYYNASNTKEIIQHQKSHNNDVVKCEYFSHIQLND